MSIESDFFANYEADEFALKAYGFERQGKRLVYEKLLSFPELTMQLIYDKAFCGRITDSETKEEYTLFRLDNCAGFSREVRNEFISVLEDIRKSCCKNLYFEFPQTRRVSLFIEKELGVKPEFLWKRFPTYAVFRKKENRKWFAITGKVPRNKIDGSSQSDEGVEAIIFKVEKESLDELLSCPGIYEAYHMNKKNWASVILDESVSDGTIFELLRKSYACVLKA